ncbi:MAG TPA: ATP-binding protein [Planctomycetes bacterium]|nr:ATP-binding protein [Planctomycetota bacterium]
MEERQGNKQHKGVVRLQAGVLDGIGALPIEIEASVRGSDFGHSMILGLADATIRESLQRIRSAFFSLRIPFPRGRLVINLAPGRQRKAGTQMDLPLAVVLAALGGAIEPAALRGKFFLGEVGLDGRLLPVPGILGLTELARDGGSDLLVCPHENAPLAARAGGDLGILPCGDLEEVLIGILKGKWKQAREVPEPSLLRADETRPHPSLLRGFEEEVPDLSRVKGQEQARVALCLAAAGGHNLLMSGPPGCGKTLLARCMQGLLPPLPEEQRLEVLRVRTSTGVENQRDLCEFLHLGRPPFRAPHHTISSAGLVGGGSPPGPGEASLAHRGILFLDELPEFQRACLETLRQPLETGLVSICRSKSRADFPADFQLIAAMNPCPCGRLGHPRLPCTDTPTAIRRYRARISGPLLDRMDLRLDLSPVPAHTILEDSMGDQPQSPALRERIHDLQRLQRERNGGVLNAKLSEMELRNPKHLVEKARKLLVKACLRDDLSARGISRVLRTARTAADWAGNEKIQEEDLATALHFYKREG